jgi:7-cyano-7-deazaguanine synthase in queuosine biosynthesis
MSILVKLVKVKVILNDGESFDKIISNSIGVPFNVSNKLIDLKTIASSIFLIEDIINNGRNVREIRIPLYENYSSNLNNLIERLIEFLFNKSIKINFVKNPQKHLMDIQDTFSDGHTCLFSGGLDSFAGILSSKENCGQVIGAFTRHADQKYLSNLIKKLQNNALRKYNVDIKTIDTDKNKDYTRITRGILYLLNALLLKNNKIIIPEVGPTMYQPRLTLLDDVSFTTHPRVMKFSKKIAEEVLGTKINIIIPNENLTKAEVAAISLEKNYIKLTCSCRTTRWCNSNKPNCGICYGCIIRRLALLVAGVEDSEYRSDILISKESRNEQYCNILHLLQFSLDFLNDFENIPNYTTEIIKKYKKEDLFERFSLDTFAGLLILKKKDKLLDNIFLKFLGSALKIVSREKLEDRIESVRNNEFGPNFKNII